MYAIEQLMEQTRKLAVDYYQTTSQTLPVSQELAKHDAMAALSLQVSDEAGIDAVTADGVPVVIKSRVLFKDDLRGYRVGQLNTEAGWEAVLLVLMNDSYETISIFSLDRPTLESALAENPNPKRQRRGAMSITKFKTLGECVWPEL